LTGASKKGSIQKDLQSNNSDITDVKKFFPVLILAFVYCSDLQAQGDTAKIEGVSLESPPFELSLNDLDDLSTTNANWLAVIPYGFSPADHPRVSFDDERQWWGEKVDGTRTMIQLAHQKNYRVMLKPQVWIFRGWVGDYGFESEQEWEDWEESYENFIITFAQLADSMGVELFCLGTEYKRATRERPHFWANLIDSVRAVYKGRLTYAANWDEYENIPFWDKLDYIGVDAYFPLSYNETPEMSELLLNWLPVKDKMKTLSDSLKRPILLTEFGYRSVNKAAGNQWKLGSSPFNEEAQRRAYLALFESLWVEKWLAGGFFWKWRFINGVGGENDRSYTPQGKSALKVIQSVYR
jgi:hypothetical protein